MLTEVRRGRTWPLYVAVAVGLYALAFLVLYAGVRRVTGGHVLFALDDPYIHLALSEQIAAGHYGINPGEPASPSSSILWPFLLALFARVSWQQLATLGLNVAAGLAAAAMMGFAVAEWPGDDGSWSERVRRVLSVVGLVLIGNLLGLTFVGMEHTLEVMLAVACALGLTGALQGRALPWWAMVAAAIAPMVRYECLTLTVAIAVCLVAERRRRQAAAVLGAAVAPLIAFSVFLRHMGLPLLPMSVLFKGGVRVGNASLRERVIHEFVVEKGQILGNWPDRLPLLLFCLMLLELGLGQRERVRRFTLLGAAAVGVVHLLVGPFGWFHRYEVYIVLFSAMLVLAMVSERPRMLLAMYAALLAAAAYPSLQIMAKIVPGTEDIYLQQYQMHRFITEFATGNVAINDLGMVSYRRRPGQKVLDLVGLGSIDVDRAPGRPTSWLDEVTRQHDVRVVMMYREPWLYPNLPADWTELGKVCKDSYVYTVVDPCVSYLATPLGDTAQLQAEFNAFARTLPPGVSAKPGAH